MADLKREGKGFAYKLKMNVALYSEEVLYYTYTQARIQKTPSPLPLDPRMLILITNWYLYF